jgi:glycosyltransferase involved in cell wall biosynthesis
MRVCFVSFEYPPGSLIMGGAGTYGSFLVKELENIGVDVDTITTGSKTDRDQRVHRISIPNIIYLRSFLFIESAMGVLSDLNRKHRFDIVHFNEPHIITRSPRLPTVVTYHNTQLNELRSNLKEENPLARNGIRNLGVCVQGHLYDVVTAQISDRIICPSSELAKTLKSDCLADEQKIHVIPNGIDAEMFDGIDYDTAFLDKYALEKGSFLVYMGRLASLKGVHYLIEAFKNIKKEYEKLKLVIAGTGEFETHLRKIASGITDVFFVGYVGSIMIKKLLYENCLAVVVPSVLETFPMVILEAMACSTPVIASNVGGIPSLVEHGKNGFLVEAGDVRGLETYIKVLCENPNLGRNMGAIGRELVEKRFTAKKMAKHTLRVYESLL